MNANVDYRVGLLVAFPAIWLLSNWPSSRSESLFVAVANPPVLPIELPNSDQLWGGPKRNRHYTLIAPEPEESQRTH